MPSTSPIRRIIAAAALLIASLEGQNPRSIRFTAPEAAQAKSLLAGGNSKIDPALKALARDSGAKSLGEMGSSAKALQIPAGGGLIAIVATADSEADIEPLVRRIEAAGGEVKSVIGESILARIPAASISRIGADEKVEYLAPQTMLSIPPQPEFRGMAESGPDNRGLLMTKANLLHQKGVRGAGVKIGIIDFGFTGYRALQERGALPEPVAVKAFGADGGWDRIDHGSEHGTACVEIIHAMAPEAQIYIASIGNGAGRASVDEIAQAADWLADQHVHIISFSGGGHDGPHNGTALDDKLVEKMVGQGILWVNAAGNEGYFHWSSNEPRLNADGYVLANGKPYIELRPTSDGPLDVLINWDDWGANPLAPTPSQDFDAYLTLLDLAAGTATIVADSANPQDGKGRPREYVSAPKARRGEVYGLFIKGAHVTKPVKLHVYVDSQNAKLDPVSAVGSIGIPATSPMAIAVGAVDAGDGKLAAYSSQGPTDDERAKPEVSAPAGIRMYSPKYKEGFFGTSAACPHVSGFAALVKEMKGSLSPQEMSRAIEAATTPLAENRGAGHGMIDGSKLIAPGGGNLTSGARRKFDLLLQRASDDNALGAKVVVGRTTYRIGDGLKIGFRARENCGCILLHRASGGEYTVLESRLRLEAGERYAYPEGSGSNIKITGPAGRDEVALLCSADPAGLERIEQADAEEISVSLARYAVVEE